MSHLTPVLVGEREAGEPDEAHAVTDARFQSMRREIGLMRRALEAYADADERASKTGCGVSLADADRLRREAIGR